MSIQNTIIQTANKYGVDPNMALKVANAESAFNPNAKSSAGAIGIFQLMPNTAKGLGVDPYNINQNIDGGVRYLKQQYDAFGGDWSKALSAYNAGAGNVKKYNGIPPFKETQNYVNKILNMPSLYNGGGGNMANQQSVDVNKYGNNGQGTAEQIKQDIANMSNPDYVTSAIERTKQVMQERQNAGMDTSVQEAYIRKLQLAQQQAGAQQQPVDPRQTMFDYMQQAQGNYVDQQKAMLEQAKASQLAEIQKAMEDAVAEGKISIRDAEAQFEAQKQNIQQQLYEDHQRTLHAGADRGISNSQQLIGLMQGDTARSNSLINENITTRDKRINDIKDRINAIKNKQSLDVARVNSEYDAGLLKANAEASMQYNQNMFNVLHGDYEAERELANQKEILKTQHGFDLEKMKTAHGYNLDELAVQLQNSLTLEGARSANEIKAISARAQVQAQQAEAEYQREMALLEKQVTPGTKEHTLYQAKLDMERDAKMANIVQESLAVAEIDAVTKSGLVTKKPVEPKAWIPGVIGGWGYADKKAQYDADLEAYNRLKAIEKRYGVSLTD